MLKISELKRNAKQHIKMYWGESAVIFGFFASSITISILIGIISAELLHMGGLAEHRYPEIFFEKNIYFLIITGLRLLVLYIFTVPALFGRCWCYMQTAKGNPAPANCLFSCYSTRGVFFRCLKLKILVDFKKLLIFLPLLVVFIFEICLLRKILLNVTSTAVSFILITAGLAFSFCLFLLYGVATMKYMLVNYLFVSNPDENIQLIIKRSTKLMKGHEKQITLLYLSFLVWAGLCLIVFPLFLILPYYNMTIAEVVNEIISEKHTEKNNTAVEEQRSKSLAGV